MLIHVPKIFNCKVSFKCHFNVLVIAENFEQLMSSNFQNCNFKIITITVTEIGFIQVFFFYRCSKQKNKNLEYHKNGVPWHVNTSQKSALFRTRELYFSLVWVVEFSIISSRLGKVKVFPIILNKFPKHGKLVKYLPYCTRHRVITSTLTTR